MERAFEQQSFGPINALFDDEEAALATYEEARAMFTKAQERWSALRAALVYERKLMAAGPLSPNMLN